MRNLNNFISIIEASEEPLSADVYFIKGEIYTYIIDVGSNDISYEEIEKIPDKKVFITHFHADHMGNLDRINIEDENLYVGDYVRKTKGRGTLVDKETVLNDGKLTIKVYPLPNSHAKGALCISINDEYLFMGDSFYCSQRGHNVSLLHDEISTLENISFQKAILSHDNTIHDRDEIIGTLKDIFSKRNKNEPYIQIYT